MGFFEAMFGKEKLTDVKKKEIWEKKVIPAFMKKVNNPQMITNVNYETATFEVTDNDIVVTFIAEGDNYFGAHLREEFRVRLEQFSYKIKNVEMKKRGLISNKEKWSNLGN
jgi:hypothetical protein